jgi:3-oxoacyl-[acyl-carrier protein] reductase
MDLGIRGKIAFVSGGSQGMGLATAKLLAEEGCRVAVVARNQQRIDDAVTAITEAGGEAIGVSADLATQEGVDRALATVRGRFGPPEIVIAQTNDFTSGDFFDVDDEDFVRVFRTFTIAYAMLARAVIPDMQAAGWGRIVHIGSAIAKEPQRDLAHIVHNTVRPSTTSMIKTLADQFSKYGITFNSIAPGYIMTDTMREFVKAHYGADADIENWVKRTRGIPAERHGTPEEIGNTIAFLCSDLAGYTTGEWITVDGGWHRSAV